MIYTTIYITIVSLVLSFVPFSSFFLSSFRSLGGDVEAGDQILMVDIGRGGHGAPASRSGKLRDENAIACCNNKP